MQQFEEQGLCDHTEVLVTAYFCGKGAMLFALYLVILYILLKFF